MSIKDFFRILIKVIGIYFLIQVMFTILPSQISFLSTDWDFSNKTEILFYILFLVLFTIGVCSLLLFFPDKIIQLFKLDNGFEKDEMPIRNFNTKNLIYISLFIVGGLLIVENITPFLSSVYTMLKVSSHPMVSINKNDGIEILFYALNILIGSVLITYRKNIADYFEK